MITVLRCIGCGAISTPQPCLGTCVDRRLDLVAADQHAAVVSGLAELEHALAQRQTLVERLARSAPAPGDWPALRAAARAALHALEAPAAGEVLTAWACDSCGRIEAPQPCIGVCIRPETPMVEAAEHALTVAAAERAFAELERLAPPLRQLAWSRPRAGHEDEAAAGVQRAARAALSL